MQNAVKINELPYSSGLMSQSFWFAEMKKLAQLKREGRTTDEIKKMCVEDNYFGAPNAYRAGRMFGYLNKRLTMMDEELTEHFCQSDVSCQKLINLLLILQGDRLFFEFVNEVYREKILLGQMYIEDSDVNVFFSQKEMQAEEVQSWKDTTKKRLKSNYFNFLTDANLLSLVQKQRVITPPLPDTELTEYLTDNGLSALLKAVTGVN